MNDPSNESKKEKYYLTKKSRSCQKAQEKEPWERNSPDEGRLLTKQLL